MTPLHGVVPRANCHGHTLVNSHSTPPHLAEDPSPTSPPPPHSTLRVSLLILILKGKRRLPLEGDAGTGSWDTVGRGGRNPHPAASKGH